MDWDQAYREYHAAVFRQLYGRTSGNVQLAQDLAQDTFVRAMRSEQLFRYDDGRGVLPWLHTIARNLLADHYRRYSTRRETPMAEFIDLDQETPSAEDIVAERERALAVLTAVSSLNLRQREAIVLSYWGRWSDARIARQVGSRPEAVKVLRCRARKNLRRQLAGVA